MWRERMNLHVNMCSLRTICSCFMTWVNPISLYSLLSFWNHLFDLVSIISLILMFNFFYLTNITTSNVFLSFTLNDYDCPRQSRSHWNWWGIFNCYYVCDWVIGFLEKNCFLLIEKLVVSKLNPPLCFRSSYYSLHLLILCYLCVVCFLFSHSPNATSRDFMLCWSEGVDAMRDGQPFFKWVKINNPWELSLEWSY